jgi:hypothetical protein
VDPKTAWSLEECKNFFHRLQKGVKSPGNFERNKLSNLIWAYCISSKTKIRIFKNKDCSSIQNIRKIKAAIR